MNRAAGDSQVARRVAYSSEKYSSRTFRHSARFFRWLDRRFTAMIGKVKLNVPVEAAKLGRLQNLQYS